ncbi:hypothetical protein, partial [Citrobacter cronae]
VVLTYQYTLEDVSTGSPSQIASSETSVKNGSLTYTINASTSMMITYQYVNFYYDSTDAKGKTTTNFCGSWFHGGVKKSGKGCSTVLNSQRGYWSPSETISVNKLKAGDKVYAATADGSSESAKIFTVLDSITLTDEMLKASR